MIIKRSAVLQPVTLCLSLLGTTAIAANEIGMLDPFGVTDAVDVSESVDGSEPSGQRPSHRPRPGDTSGPSDTPDETLETGSSTAGVLCDYIDVSYNASPSVEAESMSGWTCSDSDRELTANGIPDHDVGTFPNENNPNTITEQDITASYTLTPVESDVATELGGPRGAVGHVLNGIKMDPSTNGSCDATGDTCSGTDPTLGWNLEALGQSTFDFGEDFNNAHVQPTGEYHYHGMPEAFIEKLGGDETGMTLIGWAADGFPIYARYGYSDPNDPGSPIEPMEGSYQLVSEVDESRPSVDVYELGTFGQDWEYVEGSGDLDECNGRTGVTPEFPGGTYHYFATDSYPYMQRCVKGEVEAQAAAEDAGDTAGTDDAIEEPATTDTLVEDPIAPATTVVEPVTTDDP